MQKFMRSVGTLILLTVVSYSVFTQTASISLKEAYEKAKAVHPLSAKAALLEQGHQLELDALDAIRLPVIDLNAEGRLQSENVRLPFEIPGQPVIELPLLSAQVAVEGRYLLYDGGLTESRRQVEGAALEAELQGVEADLYQVREQVNRSFFGTLLLRAQEAILENSLSDLNLKIEQLGAGVRHGVVLPAQVDKLRIEALRLASRIEQTRGDIRGLLRTLSKLTGTEIDTTATLRIDSLDGFSVSGSLERPELELFESRRAEVLANEQLLTAQRRPQISAFARAGLGYPNPLNFFDETLSPFGLIGVRLNWKIFDWDKADKERQLLTVRSQLIRNQESVFRYNLELQQQQLLESLSTLETLIARDEEILRLQQEVLQQASAQLDQGVITPSEYLDEVNAQIRAELNLEQHRLQLQQTKINYLTIKGRY